MKKVIYLIVSGIFATSAFAQVSLTTSNPVYNQNFDLLESDHNNTTGWSLSGISWFLDETGGGSQDDELYKANDGSSATGNTYSYGTNSSTDRALGSLRSGTLISVYGTSFANNTGEQITGFTLNYVGEQWRKGSAGNVDSLFFEYSSDASSLTTGTWTKVNALSFFTPNTAAAVGALDGNLTANKTALSSSISGLTVNPGAGLWIRFVDFNGPSSDDGLAVDDLSISFTTQPAVGPVDTLARFTNTTQSVAENAGTAAISVSHGPISPSTAFSVDVVLKTGNAADIGNYTTQTVTFTPGVANASVTVNITDNALLDGNKVFEFALRNPSAPMILHSDSILTFTVVDDEVAALPVYPIALVRGANGDGEPDSLGVKCEVRGTVYGVNLRTSGLQFYINDKTAGMGVFAPAKNFGYAVSEGDSVIVRGEVGVFRGLAQMTFVDTVILAGSSNVPAPEVIVAALGEQTESELIRVNGLNLTNINDWTTGGGSFNVTATNGNGSYSIRIEANTTAISLAAPNTFFDVIGIGSQFATSTTAPFTNGYQIIPRKSEDIIINTSTEESLKDALRVFPNPTEGAFNMIAFVQNAGAYNMSVIDMSGKRVFVKNIQLHAGNNLITEDFASFKPGIYHIRVEGNQGSFHTQFVVK